VVTLPFAGVGVQRISSIVSPSRSGSSFSRSAVILCSDVESESDPVSGMESSFRFDEGSAVMTTWKSGGMNCEAGGTMGVIVAEDIAVNGTAV
jgi:hypothetical protein